MITDLDLDTSKAQNLAKTIGVKCRHAWPLVLSGCGANAEELRSKKDCFLGFSREKLPTKHSVSPNLLWQIYLHRGDSRSTENPALLARR